MGVRNIDYLDAYEVEFIYHMTHVDHVPNILQHGLLGHGNRFQKHDISNTEVNAMRARREPVYSKKIHDYVPFYFAPRNSMLLVQDNQDDIVILVYDARLIYERGAIFTDGNASSFDTHFYSDISDLQELDWSCIRGRYWNNYSDGKRTKMSEVLVPDRVDKSSLLAIYCENEYVEKRVKKMIGSDIECAVAEEYYFYNRRVL